MTRWSLRRHRHRARPPVTGAVRPDPVRPELEPAPPGAGNGHAPGGYRPDAYAPGPAEGRPAGSGVPGPFGEGRPPAGMAGAAAAGTPPAAGGWPDVMERFGLHLLTLAEQLRMSLDELEADEADPDRLQKLYQVDHAVTRMRRASRDLRTLAGRADGELSGADTSLLDVIRVAQSAIERYAHVSVGKVADFGVLGYAADDVAALLAALLDNATRYSPGLASVSAHLTEGGSVLFRIEDTGIGMDPGGVAALNAMLASEVPPPDDRTGRHTGFPVVHRIARRHSIAVRLAARPSPGSGTIALVTVPPELMCEMPDEAADYRPPPPAGPREGSVSVLRTARRVPPGPPAPPSGTSYRAAADTPAAGSAGPRETAGGADAADAPAGPPTPGELPRRERASLRGERPRPGAGAAGQAPPASAQQLAAAGRAFADDLAAFSAGSSKAQDSGKGSPP